MSQTSSLIFRNAWAAIRANLIPGVMLWLVGGILIASYYAWPTAREGLQALAEFRSTGGAFFSLVSTGIFGGLIPALVLLWQEQRGPAARDESRRADVGQERDGCEAAREGRAGLEAGAGAWTYLATNVAFWALKGLEIDALYRFQAWAFGESTDWGSLAIKVLFDQFVYLPVWGIVNVVLFYRWRQLGFRTGSLRAELSRGWYSQRVLPVMIPNWVVWIPAVGMIYCLPLPLQLPIQNLILCCWVLLLHFFTSGAPRGPAAPEEY